MIDRIFLTLAGLSAVLLGLLVGRIVVDLAAHLLAN